MTGSVSAPGRGEVLVGAMTDLDPAAQATTGEAPPAAEPLDTLAAPNPDRAIDHLHGQLTRQRTGPRAGTDLASRTQATPTLLRTAPLLPGVLGAATRVLASAGRRGQR